MNLYRRLFFAKRRPPLFVLRAYQMATLIRMGLRSKGGS